MSNFDNKINLDIAEIAAKIMSKKSTVLNESDDDYSAKKARAGEDIGKPGKQFEKIAEKAGKKYGSKEKGENVAGAILSKLRKESFSDLLSVYKTSGFIALEESLAEEVDNEKFTQEVEEAKKKATEKTKDKNGISDASVQAVKVEGVQEESYKLVSPSGDIAGVFNNKYAAKKHKLSNPDFSNHKIILADQIIDDAVIEERELSSEEKEKKEEVVKSMKSNLGDFKKRYGDRAKNVMYASATNIAKEKA